MHGEGVMHDELMKGSMGVGVGCMGKGSLRKGSMNVGVWGKGWKHGHSLLHATLLSHEPISHGLM